MKYNPQYDNGHYRVGCIGCPLAATQVNDLEKYKKYKENYIRAFQRMVDKRKEVGKHLDSKYSKLWKDGESVYAWWIQDEQIQGQMCFDLDGNMKEYKP